MRTNNIHIVKKGDTLWTIAKEHCLTLDELLEANPQITNPNLIMAGQEILIPVSPTPCPPIIETPAPNKGNDTEKIPPIPGERPLIYVVKPGDTMYRIAKGFNMELKELLKVNPHIANPDAINVGDKLFIPKAKKLSLLNIPMPNLNLRKDNSNSCPYNGDSHVCPWLQSKGIICPHCGRPIK